MVDSKRGRGHYKPPRLAEPLLGFATAFTITLVTSINTIYLDYSSPMAIPFLFVQAVWLYISLNDAATLVRLYFYREPPRSMDWKAEPPSVSVIVPLYLEPPGLVAGFAEGLLGLSYPVSRFEVVVVDDSPLEYSRVYWKILAAASAEKGFRLNYIHRGERRGYRGGAVKRGLESARGEYVVVMDVDHMPLPHMLDEMVSVAEANLGLDVVVFPQHFPERGNAVEEASRMGYAFDYLFSRKGKSVTNSAFCVGTNWIARRERILGAGGYDDSTIVEDAATSLKLWHPNGVKLGFAEALLAVGATPSSLQAWRLQQYRWSQGAFRLLPDLLATARRLSFTQILDYLYLVTWYLVGPATLASFTFPLLVAMGARLLRVESPSAYLWVVALTLAQPALSASPLLLEGEPASKVFRCEAMGLLVADVYARAALDALLGRRAGFKVTPKAAPGSGAPRVDAGALLAPLALAVANAAAAVLSYTHGSLFPAVTLWALYNLSWAAAALAAYLGGRVRAA